MEEIQHTEKKFNLSSPTPAKPFLPIWASIPLYIIASLVLMAILGGICYAIFSILPESDSLLSHVITQTIGSLATVAAVWICAWIFLVYIDRLPVSELGMSIKGRLKDCVIGFLFAVVLYIIGFAVVIGTKSITIESVSFNPIAFFGSLVFFLVAATMEEIMVRGYILGRLMSKINKFAALAISSALFSALHLANDSIGVLPLINLFLAGLLLGAAFLYTKNLWFPIVLHTFWNWIQGSVLGFEVSGGSLFPSLIKQNRVEENIINGGAFGFEGSIICTILCLAGTLAIIGWFEYRKPKTADQHQS